MLDEMMSESLPHNPGWRPNQTRISQLPDGTSYRTKELDVTSTVAEVLALHEEYLSCYMQWTISPEGKLEAHEIVEEVPAV